MRVNFAVTPVTHELLTKAYPQIDLQLGAQSIASQWVGYSEVPVNLVRSELFERSSNLVGAVGFSPRSIGST